MRELAALWAHAQGAACASKLGLLTFATVDMLSRPEISAALSSKSCYCSFNGYSYILEVSAGAADNHSAHWQRIPFLLKHLPHFDWLLYTDADTVVTNSSVRLESFIDVAVAEAPDTFLIVQDDINLNRWFKFPIHACTLCVFVIVPAELLRVVVAFSFEVVGGMAPPLRITLVLPRSCVSGMLWASGTCHLPWTGACTTRSESSLQC